MKLLKTMSLLALAMTLATTGFAQDDAKKKRRAARGGAGLVSAQVQRAVPGINALFQLDADAKKKIAALRKETLGSEAVVAAQKTMRDKSVKRKDKKAARETLAAAQAAFSKKTAALLGADRAALLAKISTAASEAGKSIRSEYQGKIKEAKGADRKAIQKEIATKLNAALSTKILSLLSDEQKAKIASAKKKAGGKKAGAKKKKEAGEKKETGEKKAKKAGRKKPGKKKKDADAEA